MYEIIESKMNNKAEVYDIVQSSINSHIKLLPKYSDAQLIIDIKEEMTYIGYKVEDISRLTRIPKERLNSIINKKAKIQHYERNNICKTFGFEYADIKIK